MKICVITLGCPKNVVDSEYLSAQFFENSVKFVDRADLADVVIINTCAFILPAREEAIETILEAVQLKNEGTIKRIYVTGCLPQRYINELQKEIPEVDGFFDQYDFTEIGKRISTQLKLEWQNNLHRRVLQTPSHYAYLKIAEGCDNRCHYCTIPEIKGNYRDRPLIDVLNEANELSESGVRELIVVAQDTTYYGWNQGRKKMFCELIESLAKINSIEWIRILYAHPAHLTDCIFQQFDKHQKLCRYLDLPIQHVSDEILKSMGRPYTENEIRNLINGLRQNIPGIAIRTTMIVGYPGENLSDFERLKNFVIEAEFERLGVFKYFPEDGTLAAKLPNQVEDSVKEDRYEEIMEIQAEIALKKNRLLIGQTIPVIIDEWDEGDLEFKGRTQWDSPLIDNIVHVAGNAAIGQIQPIEIKEATEYDLLGEVTNPV